jgi:hypothetical protein
MGHRTANDGTGIRHERNMLRPSPNSGNRSEIKVVAHFGFEARLDDYAIG